MSLYMSFSHQLLFTKSRPKSLINRPSLVTNFYLINNIKLHCDDLEFLHCIAKYTLRKTEIPLHPNRDMEDCVYTNRCFFFFWITVYHGDFNHFNHHASSPYFI